MAGILEYMRDNILLFDGAMGTMLQARGVRSGELEETFNDKNSELILDIHKAYVKAGADVVTANTFQANEIKMGSGARDANLRGVELSRKSGAKFVALDVGSLGQMLKPLGTLDFEDAFSMFRTQMRAGRDAGADVILIETFSDIYEAKAAILAAKEETELPIFCSMSFEENGRTFMGMPADAAVVALQALGVSAVGANCSLGPALLKPIIETILQFARVPVLLQANAGLPKMEDGRAVYDLPIGQYIEPVLEMLGMGVSIVGGCCGTTPETIAALSKVIKGMKPARRKAPRVTACASASACVVFGGSAVRIGERINPSGRPELIEAINGGEFYLLADEAADQVSEGAQVLDVNVAVPCPCEAAALKSAVTEIQMMTAAPLALDSTDAAALEAGLRAYRGRPILNSVTGKKEDMARLFPLAKKYGALVIGMAIDERGVPDTARKRLEIARKLLASALEHGLAKEDLLIDCVTLTKAYQEDQMKETIEAVRLVNRELGLKTVLGISNVSHGLPEREKVNAAFLTEALAAGLNAAIYNPAQDSLTELMENITTSGQSLTET